MYRYSCVNSNQHYLTRFGQYDCCSKAAAMPPAPGALACESQNKQNRIQPSSSPKEPHPLSSSTSLPPAALKIHQEHERGGSLTTSGVGVSRFLRGPTNLGTAAPSHQTSSTALGTHAHVHLVPRCRFHSHVKFGLAFVKLCWSHHCALFAFSVCQRQSEGPTAHESWRAQSQRVACRENCRFPPNVRRPDLPHYAFIISTRLHHLHRSNVQSSAAKRSQRQETWQHT